MTKAKRPCTLPEGWTPEAVDVSNDNSHPLYLKVLKRQDTRGYPVNTNCFIAVCCNHYKTGGDQIIAHKELPMLTSDFDDNVRIGEAFKEAMEAMYEARHPWLDFAHALELNLEEEIERCGYFLVMAQRGDSKPTHHLVNADHGHIEMFCGDVADSLDWHEDLSILAFKPFNPSDFSLFESVKVWEGDA
jgi:hypothetical protein